MSGTTKVTSVLGFDVHCDEEGNFSARVNEEFLCFKSMKRIKEEIAKAAPTVELTALPDKGRGYYHNTLAIQRVKIAVVDQYSGIVVGRPNTATARYSGTRYTDLFVPDEVVEEELKRINLAYADTIKALDTDYNAAVFKAKAKMVAVTPELFAEMLAAKVAEKGGAVE